MFSRFRSARRWLWPCRSGGPPARRPMVARLEDRYIHATLAVTNTDDSGTGSLLQAIADANISPGADNIQFDATVTGTVFLTTGELLISDAVTITGPGANKLALDGSQISR